MAEYINREAVLKFQDELEPCICWPRYGDGSPCFSATKDIDLVQFIKDIPAADVVVVVRCKDCQHSENDPRGIWCYNMCFYMPEMFYCANGERRTET